MLRRAVFYVWLMTEIWTNGVKAGDFDNDYRSVNISEEKRLTQHLLRTYSEVGRGGRPVVKAAHPTVVEFGLGLIQMDLDEKDKVLTTSMWTRMKWKDEYLTWNPDDFDGVATARIEMQELWIPDIMLYNTADTEFSGRNVLVIVKSDGTLQWVSQQIFRSSCSIDVAQFPFDTQLCHMWYGSWTHGHKEIDLELAFAGGIDLKTFQDDYKESSEWEITSSAANKIVPGNDSEGYAVLGFHLELERKMVFSNYILTLPCVFLATLTLIVFCLPPERPDRTGLAMSIFSSFLVLLLILVETAPSSASSVPKLGIYYCFNMVIIMASIFLSCLVVNVNVRGNGNKQLPVILRFVFLDIIGRLVCIVEHKDLIKGFPKSSKSVESCGELAQKTPLLDVQCHKATSTYTISKDNEGEQTTLNHDWFCLVNARLTDVQKYLKYMMENIEQKATVAARAKKCAEEWHRLARILDRVFFLIYTVAIIYSLAVMFPRRFPKTE